MTGKSATSWSWLHRVAIPALLVIAEATWVSLLIDAVINTSGGPHADVPFLAVATSAVAAVTVAGVVGRTTSPWWRHVLILIPVVVVGASFAASHERRTDVGVGFLVAPGVPAVVSDRTHRGDRRGHGLVRGCAHLDKRHLAGHGVTILSRHGVVPQSGSRCVHRYVPRQSRPTRRGIQGDHRRRRLAVVPLVPAVRHCGGAGTGARSRETGLVARLIPALGPVADHPQPADAGCGPDCAGRRRRDRPGRPDCGPCRGRSGHGGLGCGRDRRKVALGPDPKTAFPPFAWARSHPAETGATPVPPTETLARPLDRSRHRGRRGRSGHGGGCGRVSGPQLSPVAPPVEAAGRSGR